jgi:hypothetical protein
MNMNDLQRKCPKCEKTIFYTNKISFLRATKNNPKCNSCSLVGKKYTDRKSPTYKSEEQRLRVL